MDFNNSLDRAKEGTDEFLLSCDNYDYYLHYDSKNETISVTAHVKESASLKEKNDTEKEVFHNDDSGTVRRLCFGKVCKVGKHRDTNLLGTATGSIRHIHLVELVSVQLCLQHKCKKINTSISTIPEKQRHHTF